MGKRKYVPQDSDHKEPIDDGTKTLAISFKYMTSNQDYNIHRKFKGGDGGKKLQSLFKLLAEASNTDWTTFSNSHEGKTLPIKKLDPSGKFNTYTKLDSDQISGELTKVTILRFNGKECRALFTVNKVNKYIAYLIACDFDLTLYSHG